MRSEVQELMFMCTGNFFSFSHITKYSSYDYWGEGEIFKKYSSSNYLGPSHSEDYVSRVANFTEYSLFA